MSTLEHQQGANGLTLLCVSYPLRYNPHLVVVENNEEVLLSSTNVRDRYLGAKFGPSIHEKSTYIMSPLARVQIGYKVGRFRLTLMRLGREEYAGDERLEQM